MRERCERSHRQTAVLSARDALFSSRRHCFRRNWSGATTLTQTSARENLLHSGRRYIRAHTVIMEKPLDDRELCCCCCCCCVHYSQSQRNWWSLFPLRAQQQQCYIQLPIDIERVSQEWNRISHKTPPSDSHTNTITIDFPFPTPQRRTAFSCVILSVWVKTYIGISETFRCIELWASR